MRAVLMRGPKEAPHLEEVPKPEVGPEEALIQIKASGLCASDLAIVEGRMPIQTWPLVLGHQAAGVVAAVGEKVQSIKVGDRVVSTTDITCGDCHYCRKGRPNLCRNLKRLGFEMNGSDAEYVKAPQGSVVPLPAEIPFDQGAILTDALASMYHCIVKQAQVRPGEKVVLLGIGGMGMQGVQIAHLCGATVLCTSRQDRRLEFALQLGAEATVNTAREDLASAVRAFTYGEGADVVVDSIGASWTMQLAVELLRPGGRAMVVGLMEPTFTAPYLNMCVQEKQIIGSRASTKQDVIDVIGQVKAGKLNPIVSQSFPLDQFQLAFETLGKGEILARGVLIP